MAGGGAVENEGPLTPGQDGGREHTGVGARPCPLKPGACPAAAHARAEVHCSLLAIPTFKNSLLFPFLA